MRIISSFIIVVFSLVMAGCSGDGPTSPSKDDWRGPGARPVTVNMTVYASDGSMSIFIEKMTPAPGGTAKVGEVALFWPTIINPSSEKFLRMQFGVVDDKNQVGRGRRSTAFSGSIILKPGERYGGDGRTLGATVSVSERITYLRISFDFVSSFTEEVGPEPEFFIDIELRWELVP